jgi:hypothetical protein
MQLRYKVLRASMCSRSDIEQIMLVRRAIEHLLMESMGAADFELFQEYLRLVDELKVEIECGEVRPESEVCRSSSLKA